MESVRLGCTGVQVSKLCFGTMSFGGVADADESARMYRACREAGINFFDCANVYAGGQSEQLLGRLVRGERDDLVITSKVGMGEGWEAGLSRRAIMLAVEGSLQRLATDRLDIYFCHRFDDTVPIEQTLRVFDDLVRQGKVLYVGLSNWAAWQVATALGVTRREALAPVAVLQPMYNLAKRTAEIEILPLAEAERLAVVPYNPLGGGLLTGRYRRAGEDPQGRLATQDNYRRRYITEPNLDLAERFCAFADDLGVHPVTLAVAWVARHPAVTCPILGARRAEQLEPSLAAASYVMPDEQWNQISALTAPVPPATDRTDDR
jgi:aryl-alcohol dehydrogenase-like predicted oxidoreductase